MKDFIYEYFHTSLYGCHQGVDRTVAKIKALFHWPALEQFVRQKIQNCLPCQRSKPDQSGAKGHLSSFLTSKPNEKLFIDVAGPLPMSDGYHFVFIAVDAFSRFVFLIPLRKATSETVIKSLQNHIFNNFGLWNSVCSDNDTIFTSKRFTTFLFSHGIHHQRLIRHYPNPNLAERQIKNMKSAIIAFHAEDQTKWSQDLPSFQAALNSAVVSSTGFTPARIFLGRELLTPLHLRWDESNQSSDASIPPPADLWKVVYENLVRAHRKMQRDYNSKHKHMQFSVGDLVLLKTYILSNKLKHVSTKLSFRYSDPYEITKIKSPVTYELKNVANPEDLKLAHVSQLKKFLPKRSAILLAPRAQRHTSPNLRRKSRRKKFSVGTSRSPYSTVQPQRLRQRRSLSLPTRPSSATSSASYPTSRTTLESTQLTDRFATFTSIRAYAGSRSLPQDAKVTSASPPANTGRRSCTESGRHFLLTPLDAVAPNQGVSSWRTQLQQLTPPASRPGSSPGGTGDVTRATSSYSSIRLRFPALDLGCLAPSRADRPYLGQFVVSLVDNKSRAWQAINLLEK
ncbi:unnamed protein product [Nesidiocoris tenuis]|nr:unnamed protein product [Nesidiocoris tenuis]